MLTQPSGKTVYVWAAEGDIAGIGGLFGLLTDGNSSTHRGCSPSGQCSHERRSTPCAGTSIDVSCPSRRAKGATNRVV